MTEVGVDLLLTPARPFELQALARRFDEGERREHASASAVEQLIAHGPALLDELLAWVGSHGLERLEPELRPLRRLRLRGTLGQLQQAFGDAGLRALARRESGAPAIASADVLPPRLRGLVARVELSSSASEPWRRTLELGDEALDQYPVRPAVRAVTPAAFERALNLPPTTDGAGQRIALMALGGLPRARDLAVFHAAFTPGTAAPLRTVQLGPLSPSTRDDPLFRHETTMTVAWIRALAPAAELCVYVIDPRHVADPWALFFEAALDDDATIATTAWSSPEQQYYASHGRSVAATLLDQLAARGCTVIAASGDWGACAGAPRFPGDEVPMQARPWPGVAFPCSEPRVLAVGGTMGFEQPQVLSAALSPDLAARLGLREFATGGGFSEHVAIPRWQTAMLRPIYPRDADAVAIPPSGRAVPDLALPAWGVPAGPGPAGHGYWGFIDDRWRHDIGGTSLSAALAAACFARVNQALAADGHPRIGCIGPRLWALANASAGAGAVRPVERGSNRIELPCLDHDGRVRWRTVPGFIAVPGWNPGAGLGVPDFARMLALIRAGAATRPASPRRSVESRG